ncbi:bifunctional diguanylate cyclase/phosphodiesterase [Amphritea sp. 1_MG-2023]|uniref:GGDEF domain-containing protein n=1 Tax=Amphritea sp. 1_MG-2023 TaxID=3062670 RepID=UPI0026E283C6|nr:bifunctional diguanylate cyclase/phosphodiesterase [Amphritea sp. 1_MG-2023]MDO6563257.1 bifunctional diguanylate cyclase/phosphodiesterase [Amphritea sp. 1_MG-2023]
MTMPQTIPDRYALLHQLIETEQLYPHFQPIVDLRRGEILGHEALIRGPQESELYSPLALFNTAMECGLEHRLELLCRRLSLEAYARLSLAGKLFLNVSASLLGTPEHRKGLTAEWLKTLDIPLDSIVIEISEKHPFDNYGLTFEAINHYKQMGFKVAVDDLGTGYSGLKLWSELQPDYVKIDRHFIHNVDREPIKRQFVKSIFSIANGVGSKVIVEGVETRSELITLKELGATIGQGFYLGRPTLQPEMRCDSEEWLPRKRRAGSEKDMAETAAVLIHPAPALNFDDQMGPTAKLFSENSLYDILAVLEEGRPIGTIHRSDLLELFSTQYGRALYEHRPVTCILDTKAIMIEADTSLEQVSRLITEQDAVYLHQGLVITKEGHYQGIGNVRDLLKSITELKIRNARYANPLTLLPGNVPINREIDGLLKQTENFRVAYFDINFFKPFNDSYGYVKGDRLIQLLGELLTQHAHGDSFTGHIGGDDFVVVFRTDDWQSRCELILTQFDQAVREFYSPADLQQGGTWAMSRNGEAVFYSMLSLSCGVVHPDPYRCASYHEVAELAAEAKKQAKQREGSHLFVSTRRDMRVS